MTKLINLIKQYFYYLILLIGFICSLFSGIRIYYLIPTLLYPICMLIYSRHMNNKKDELILIIVNVISVSIRLYNFLGIVLIFSIILNIGIGLIYSGLFILDNKINKYNKILGLFCYPLLNLLFELIFCELIPGGSIVSYACSFAGSRYLIQTASIFGINVLSFILILSSSIIECMISKRYNKNIILLISYGFIICFIFVFGIIRINKLDKIKNSDTCKVMGSIWTYIGPMGDDFFPTLDENKEFLKTSITSAINNNVDILCFFEETFVINKSDEEEFIQYGKELIKEEDLIVFIPLQVMTDIDLKDENKEIIITNNNQVEYYKSFLVPVMETFTMVEGNRVIPKINYNGVTYSSIICCDDTVSTYVSRMDNDTDVLVIPSWDWDPIYQVHTRILKFRAIENGINLIKVNYGGDNVVIDPSGKITYQYNPDKEGYDTYWISEYHTNHINTIFSKYGKLINISIFVLSTIYFIYIWIILIRKKTKM